MDLSVIIVSFKVRDLLADCLRSVYGNRNELDIEVIVIDNCSKDGTAELVREMFPETKLIENEQNLGFARANNQGIALSRGRYILFLNPDTVVLENALKHAVEFIDRNPEVGVVGCKILNQDGTLQHSCRSFPNILNYLFEGTILYKVFPKNEVIGKFYMTHFDYDRFKDVDVVLGAFLLTKREVLEMVGLYDERFFLYSEETDFCYRTKKAGWKVCYFPKAQIIHLGGQSAFRNSLKSIMEDHRSRFLFMQKHYSSLTVWISEMIIFSGVFLRVVLWTFILAYSKVFDRRKLEEAKDKFSMFSRLWTWYVSLGFKK